MRTQTIDPQDILNQAVARRLRGSGFQRTGSLAKSLGCTRPQILAAFDAFVARHPDIPVIRVHGFEAGGMGRA